MKSTEYNDKSERTLITALITDATVLGKVAAKWDGDSFSSANLNRIADWCVNHFRKHGTAPGKGIAVYFEEWAGARPDSQESVEMVRGLLEGLSQELESSAEPMNSALVIDLMSRRFTQTKLVKHAESILANVQAGKVNKAKDIANRFDPPKLESSEAVHLFIDEDAVRDSFATPAHDQLVEYPDDLGKFFRNSLEREGFVCFCSPQKVGKSKWLMDVAYRAMTGCANGTRKRVAYFQIGDMTQQEAEHMFFVRAAEHPIRCGDDGWPTAIKWPTEIVLPANPWKEISTVKRETRTFKGPLGFAKAWPAMQRVQSKLVRSHKSYFSMRCFPNLSVSILDIEAILDDWAREGWIADVCVIDYMDNLQPVDKWEKEARNQVNTTWKLTRALAMKKKCLVVTATQVKAAGFSTFVLNKTHFSEDNRKLNHVTGMVGLNVMPDEKASGLYRLNWIAKRFGGFNWEHTIHVAACLGLENPSVLSVWPRKKGGSE